MEGKKKKKEENKNEVKSHILFLHVTLKKIIYFNS